MSRFITGLPCRDFTGNRIDDDRSGDRWLNEAPSWFSLRRHLSLAMSSIGDGKVTSTRTSMSTPGPAEVIAKFAIKYQMYVSALYVFSSYSSNKLSELRQNAPTTMFFPLTVHNTPVTTSDEISGPRRHREVCDRARGQAVREYYFSSTASLTSKF
jgi:hypothetical protein